MELATIYTEVDMWATFIAGIILGALAMNAFWVLGFFWQALKPSKVIDAEFVNVKPRPTNSPQIQSSTTLITRSRVERRNYE